MLISALLLLQAAPAVPCTATPAPLPAELAGWSAHRPVTATSDAPPMLTVGQGTRATLLPTASVPLAVPTTRPQAPGTSAGVFAFNAASAGRYRVALGAGLWVDVVQDGKALPSVSHGHGAACSPVHKLVDFDLKPGRHLLQIVGSTAPTVDLLVTRLP